MQGGTATRAWFAHFAVALTFFLELAVPPSVAAFCTTLGGTGIFQSRSPIRWSSQMLFEK